MNVIVAKAPNLRSLALSGFKYLHWIDFSCLRDCPNLEIFHLSRTSYVSDLVEHDAEKLSYLKNLIEIDLHDCPIGANAMLTLLKALPTTLRRFRHLDEVAMKYFSFVVQRFPKLEEFAIIGTVKEQRFTPTDCCSSKLISLCVCFCVLVEVT